MPEEKTRPLHTCQLFSGEEHLNFQNCVPSAADALLYHSSEEYKKKPCDALGARIFHV